MKKFPSILPLALALGLSGCSLAPTYERPAAPVDAAYPSGPAYGNGAALAGATTPAAEVGWRDFFQDPLLQRLIELSLAGNRDMRVAALNVEAVAAQYRIQRSALLPSAGIAAEGSSQRTPADLSRTGKPTVSHTYQVGLAASWEIDLFGRLRSLSDVALETYLAQDETRIAAQLSLIAATADSYLTLRADQELLGLTRDTLKNQQESYGLVRQSYDHGVATELDLSQAETALRTAESNQAQYLRLVAQDFNALTLLIGQPLPDDLAAQLGQQAGTLPDDILPVQLPAGLPSDLLERRPDVRAAEHLLRGANANIGAARAAFFPTISLTGSAGTASASLGGLFKAGSGAWSFAPQLTTPLFAGGSLLAELDLAKVQKRIEVARYEQSIQTGFREVADALAGRGTLDEQIRSQRLLVDASQRAYTVSQQRFQAGVDNYLAVLDSQRSLYVSQQSLIATRLGRLINLIDLYKALGGGWTETTGSQAAEAQTAEAQAQ